MISNSHSCSNVLYPVWFVPVALLGFLKTTNCNRVLKLQRWGVLSWVQHQMARTQNFTVILSVKNTSFSKMVISSVIFLLQLWYELSWLNWRTDSVRRVRERNLLAKDALSRDCAKWEFQNCFEGCSIVAEREVWASQDRMLVTLKNLQQQTFQIEIAATDSVSSNF